MTTYTGSNGNDTLGGSSGADTLAGGLGNDIYLVNSLRDSIVEAAGAGFDSVRTALLDSSGGFSLLRYANVEALVFTGAGAARLRGNDLDNLIQAGSGSTADTLYGGAGDDTLLGGGGKDRLEGGSGADWLDGGTGADSLIGGSGDDRYFVDNLGDRVFETANAGFDIVESDGIVLDISASRWVNVEGIVHTGSAAVTMVGNAAGNLVQSLSAGADRLLGGAGNDTLDGGAGNDTLIGGIGDDVYQVTAGDAVTEAAGEGEDSFVGLIASINRAGWSGSVENLIYTGATRIALTGNGLDNLIVGGAGANIISAGVGDDVVFGGAGTDSILGGNGKDTLYGGDTGHKLDGVYGDNALFFTQLLDDGVADTLVGGLGDDRYVLDNLDDRVVEAAGGGSDTVVALVDYDLTDAPNVENLVLDGTAWFGAGTAAANILVGSSGENYLDGGAGNDTLLGAVSGGWFGMGGAPTDVLDGGSGADVLIARQSSVLFGGTGDDLYLVDAGYGAVISGSDDGGNDTLIFTNTGSAEAMDGVETLLLYGSGLDVEAQAQAALAVAIGVAGSGSAALYTAFADLTGNDEANAIGGNDSANLLRGLGGNDHIYGFAGNDTLDGGLGVDTLEGGDGGDLYRIDAADSVIETGSGGLDIVESDSVTSYAGYAGIEGLSYTGSTARLFTLGAANTSNDWFSGGSGDDTLRGYAGADTLAGGAGGDSIDGGSGDDSLSGNAGSDLILGGDGNDEIYATAFAANGDGGNDTLLGGAGSDRLQGSDGADSLDGGGGYDQLHGSAGNDTLHGGDDGDYLYGEAGDDVLYGDAGDDSLSGGAGSDLIFGGGGVDTLAGGADADVLYALAPGGGSTAQLWGGESYGGGDNALDLFRFDALSATGYSAGTASFRGGIEIGDFENDADYLWIDGALVGNGDATLGFTQEKDFAGGNFARSAEIVFVRADVDSFSYNWGWSGSIAAAGVTAAIGTADSAFAVGDARLFVVDDGRGSAVFGFVSANADAVVSASELSLLAVVNNDSALTAADFQLFA
ncbi:calcium-binding protein [Derxia lacustris]|uniref:calcium-binding protein n=1 Tax=Derxia lacustris TaxID=764842 RepID=UPI000A176086|nr:calcium-binding protein [Derxia lacustris]